MRKFNFCFSIMLSLATIFGCYDYTEAANSAIVALSESKNDDIYTISTTVDPNGTTVCSLFSSFDFDNTKLVIQSVSLGDSSYQNANSDSFNISTINSNSSLTANLGFPNCKTSSFTAFSFTAVAGDNRGDVLIATNSLSLMGGSNGMESVSVDYDLPVVMFSTVVDTPAVSVSTSSTVSGSTSSTVKRSSKKATSTSASTPTPAGVTEESTDNSSDNSAGVSNVSDDSNDTVAEAVASKTTDVPIAKTNKNNWLKYLFIVWGVIIVAGIVVLVYRRKKPSLEIEKMPDNSIPVPNISKPEPATVSTTQPSKKELPIFGPKGNFVYSDLKPVHAKHWA